MFFLSLIFIKLEQQSHEKNVINIPFYRWRNRGLEVRWLAQGHSLSS